MATSPKPFIPFDERPPASFAERRTQSYAAPQGSRRGCAECRLGWALSHGEPGAVEQELRVS